jgi:maltose phosphorylase
MAYTFYLRTSLGLDDTTKKEEGCHITSMAGTWMSIVEVLVECELKTIRFIFPKIPKEWKGIRLKLISETRF